MQGDLYGNPQRPDSSFDRGYGNLFPAVSISYKASKNHQWGLNMGRRIDRLAYQDLNPFLFFIDPYTYEVGNPFLKPQFTNNIEVSHTFKGFLTTTLNYCRTKDFHAQTFEQEKLPNGEMVDVDAATLLVNMNNQFKFNKGWSGELSGFYRSRGAEGQIMIDPMGQVAAGVAKQVLQGKGTIKVNIRDIFYTQVVTGQMEFQNTAVNFRNARDSRVGTISFTYRFGKPMKAIPQRRTGGAKGEQNRVKMGEN
jgi:hypothetical protein